MQEIGIFPNKERLYYKEYHNENHFNISKNRLREICGAKSTYKFCPAKKYVAYKRLSKAHIFHVRNHTCKAKNSCPRPSAIVESAVAVNPTTPPGSIQSAAILKAIRKKKPWQKVKTDSVCNTRKISNETIKQKKNTFSKLPSQNSILLAK